MFTKKRVMPWHTSGIKLLEHAMKVLERVIEGGVRKIVKIDSMQFGFMAGRGTTDAIFIVSQLQEKYLAKNKGLWQRIRNFGWLLWTRRKHLIGCIGRLLGGH